VHESFSTLIDDLHPKYEQLIRMMPCRAGALPKAMPTQGVYLFSEGDDHAFAIRAAFISCGRSRGSIRGSNKRFLGLFSVPQGAHLFR
jgi:hypothetical protein